MKYSNFNKTIRAVIIAVIAIAVVFLGINVIKTSQTVTYKNDKYGFSLNLPKDFAADVQIREGDNIIYFVNKEIQKTDPAQIFGVVGRIEIYDKKEYTRESLKGRTDIYAMRFLGENEKYYFGWAHATDVQYPPDNQELFKKYRSMEESFNDIIKTFRVTRPRAN